MTRMLSRAPRARRVAAPAVVLLSAGVALAAADRPLSWDRAGVGNLERTLNTGARKGLRLAAVSDGLPACSVMVMQTPEPAGGAVEYRVVGEKELAGALDGLVAQGFVPRAAPPGIGARREVVFEKTSAPAPGEAWRLIEFETLEAMGPALAAAAADGYRPRLLVRPPFRSWPGLSERGRVLVARPREGGALESRVVVATRRNVDAESRDVAASTKAGWQVDLFFTSTRDGGPTGRRERGVVMMSRPAGATTGVEVTIERRSSFGLVAEQFLGAGPYWDEYLFASADHARRQTWASPLRLGANDVGCGPLPIGFLFDAPKDLAWSIIGLVARPAVTGQGAELLYITDQSIGMR
jgi:hypothetical protein